MSKSSDPTTKKRVEELSKQLKQHEGHLLPQLDQSSNYQVSDGKQQLYYSRFTSLRPTVMKFEFIQDLEKALNIEPKWNRVSVGCSPSRNNCDSGSNAEFIPAEWVISPYRNIDGVMLCWHLEKRFSDMVAGDKILDTDCRDY